MQGALVYLQLVRPSLHVCRPANFLIRLLSFTTVTQPTPDDLRKAIRETRELIKGNKPFGVNITILPAIVPPDYGAYARAAIEEGRRKCD